MTALDEICDPQTTTRRLTKLAQDASAEMLQRIAAHPNASDVLLAKLVFRYPAEVLANPRVTMFALAGEAPPFLTAGGRVLLYAQPTAPIELLDAGAQSTDPLVGLALRANPAATRHPRSTRVDLSTMAAFTALIAELPPLPRATVQRFGWFFAVLDPHATPEDLSRELNTVPVDKVAARQAIQALVIATSRRTDLPTALVRRLLDTACAAHDHLRRLPRQIVFNRPEDPAPAMAAHIRTLLRHPALADELVSLALDADQPAAANGLRVWAAAAVRDTGRNARAVVALASDPRAAERAVAAHALSIPRDLARLGRDPDPRVRRAVAINPHAPLDTLVALLADPESPAVPLDLLAAHDDPRLHGAAATSPWAAVRRVAARATHDLAMLQALAADPCPFVRAAVGARSQTPEAALRALATDVLPVVRGGVAKNARAPHEVLEQLARDAVPSVRRCVRTNLHAPQSIKRMALS